MAAIVLAAAVAPEVSAQSAQPKRLYDEAVAREASLRRELQNYRADEPTFSLLRRVRALTSAYEDMSRLFPNSGHADQALWRGALLSADAFWQFGEADDRTTALRLFDQLTSRFPTSSFLKQIGSHVKRLTDAPATQSSVTAPQPAVSSVPPARVTSPAPPAVLAPPPSTSGARPTSPPPATPAAAGAATLTSIRREVLPEALRFTLELTREVKFRDERLDGPPRVFIDLFQTRVIAPLKDAAIPFPDDVVRQVRIGRQPDARTRVVLDLEGASRHSVYTLYEPYRIVIDFERTLPSDSANAAPTSRMPVTDAGTAPVAETQIASASTADVTPSAPPVPLPIPSASASPSTSSVLSPTPPAVPSANRDGTFSLSRQLGLGVARIVIDPGHGGHDPGAKIKGLTEAELVLDVALRLEALLASQPEVEVVLTRRGNTYVPLEERTAIANRADADLFLSIHANASGNAATTGVETYFLNFAPNPAAERIAARENAGSSRSMRELPDILRAITLNNKIDESRDFAAMVQTSLYTRLRREHPRLKNLGVKQAPFAVLIGATMPSALAEIAFITNAQEAARLKTAKYRQQIAEALLGGILRYQQSLKKAPAIAAQ